MKLRIPCFLQMRPIRIGFVERDRQCAVVERYLISADRIGRTVRVADGDRKILKRMIDVMETRRQRIRQRIAELLAVRFVVFLERQMDLIGYALLDHIITRRVFLRIDAHARCKIVKVAADISGLCVRRIPRCPSHSADEKR